MFDLILRQARLVDDKVIDIALKDGKIAALGKVSGEAREERLLDGKYYVSAGWIDSHVHCYPKSPIYHDQPDSIGIATGVTTVVDAGSTGANDIDEFYEMTRNAKTEVYALLNISRLGLVTQNELSEMANIDKAAVRRAVKRYSDFIVGIKARISSSVVGANGIKPLEVAKEMQHENGELPLMVHIGNAPPHLDDIADLLTGGDILTHCYHGKPERILTPAGELRASVSRAIQRGVRLDVGHGTASFSFEVAKIAIEKGILPHSISSDIYCRNRLNGPVHSLGAVMSTFFSLGLSLPQVIDCVTAHAADGLRLTQKGRLAVGLDGDLTLFELRRQPTMFTDSQQQTLHSEQMLVAHAAVRAGKWFDCEQGKTKHAFNL